MLCPISARLHLLQPVQPQPDGHSERSEICFSLFCANLHLTGPNYVGRALARPLLLPPLLQLNLLRESRPRKHGRPASTIP
jgi:hypothetical protein